MRRGEERIRSSFEKKEAHDGLGMMNFGRGGGPFRRDDWLVRFSARLGQEWRLAWVGWFCFAWRSGFDAA
jgi:hypothetical protein